MEKLPELMKVRRMCIAIDMSTSAAYEGIAKGEIPHVRVAGQIRVPRQWVEQKIREALTADSLSQGVESE